MQGYSPGHVITLLTSLLPIWLKLLYLQFVFQYFYQYCQHF